MKKYMFALTAAVVSLSTAGAFAGGFGTNGNSSMSSGLINVSPSIGLGNITALNDIASSNAILSGNVGNNVGVVSGVLSGIGANLFGVNSVSGANSAVTGFSSYKLGKR